MFAAIGGLFSNAFNIFSRYFLKDDADDASSWAWFFELGRFLIFGALAIFDFSITHTPKAFILLFLVGLSEFVSVYFTMKMHAYSHVSISTILARTRLIWIPLIALIFLGERLSLHQYIGILVVFAGVSIAVSPRKLFIDKGAMYANLGAFSLAINTVLLKTLESYASYSFLLMCSALPSVILFPLLMKDRSRLINPVKKRLPLKIAAIGLHAISIYFFLFALRTGDVSRVNGIYQGMLVTSILFGIIVFKERQDIAKKLIGAAVTIAGIFLLR